MNIPEDLNPANDWTANGGVANSSPAFLEAVAAVKSLLLEHRMAYGHFAAERLGRLIVAQLAHKHGFAPKEVSRGA